MNLEKQVVIKPWGKEYLCYQNKEVAIWVLEIKKGHSTSLHAHPRKNTALIILQGDARLYFIRGAPKLLSGLDKINIFRGRFHQTLAVSDVVMLEVEAPNNKRDIVRLADNYGRVGEKIEQATKADNHLLRIENPGAQRFADCLLFTCHVDHAQQLAGYSKDTIFITLSGGIQQGLVPPGDAIDGATLSRLAQAFSPYSNSTFLVITK